MKYLFAALFLFLTPRSAHSSVPCTDTATCERHFQSGSVCRADGTCTNPFASGCLRRLLETDHPRNQMGLPMRTCNSDDGWMGTRVGDESGYTQCTIPDFDFLEVRIGVGNWESSLMIAWILQIILSELLNVPSTIETDLPVRKGGSSSFYDIENNFTFSSSVYNWEGLETALEIPSGDCRTVPGSNCHHIIPEVWPGQTAIYSSAEKRGVIEAMSSIDVVGRIGLYVPRFTADQVPSVTRLVGLKGQENRKKLADMFKRPITWGIYCDEFSLLNCSSSNDDVASRPPANESESSAYFVRGLYRGYFRDSERNDCVSHPDTCTGHLVDTPCDWSFNAKGLIYWNNIALDTDGPKGTVNHHDNFTYSQKKQIWHAANETKSHIMMVWYSPEASVDQFFGSPGEFVTVEIQKPTIECIDAWPNNTARCMDDPAVYRGQEKAACDEESSLLKMAISSTLHTREVKLPEPKRSGADNLVKDFHLNTLVMEKLFRDFYKYGADRRGYDVRNTVCSFVVEHIEDMKGFIPDGYPRIMNYTSRYDRNYTWFALAVGALSIFLTLATATLTYHWRKKKAIVYAQPDFIALILAGHLLVSVGAVVYTAEPSLEICVARQWLVTLGYSLELTPLIIKVSAINKLLRQAKKMRRAYLPRKSLFGIVGVAICLIVTYLSVWTALDPPRRKQQLILSDRKTETGSAYVDVQGECSSSFSYWKNVAFCWQGILLICGTALAFQTRNMRQEFNESLVLAIMMYSHCVFLLLIIIVDQLFSTLSSGVCDTATSYILSLDSLVSLIVYFAPKIRATGSKTSNQEITTFPDGKSYIPKLPYNTVVGLDNCSRLGGHCEPCTCFSNFNGIKNNLATQAIEEEKTEMK